LPKIVKGNFTSGFITWFWAAKLHLSKFGRQNCRKLFGILAAIGLGISVAFCKMLYSSPAGSFALIFRRFWITLPPAELENMRKKPMIPGIGRGQ
jgi:hypothetical protein